MKSYLGRFAKRLAIVFTIIYIITEIVLLILLSLGKDVLILFPSITASGAIVILLLFSLASAHARIDRLENILHKNKILSDKDMDTLDGSETDTTNADKTNTKIHYCEKCGYQLFDNDTECPYCHTKIQETNNYDLNNN